MGPGQSYNGSIRSALVWSSIANVTSKTTLESNICYVPLVLTFVNETSAT